MACPSVYRLTLLLAWRFMPKACLGRSLPFDLRIGKCRAVIYPVTFVAYSVVKVRSACFGSMLLGVAAYPLRPVGAVLLVWF